MVACYVRSYIFVVILVEVHIIRASDYMGKSTKLITKPITNKGIECESLK